MTDIRASYIFRYSLAGDNTFTVPDISQNSTEIRTAYIPLDCFAEGVYETDESDNYIDAGYDINSPVGLSIVATFESTTSANQEPIVVKIPIEFSTSELSPNSSRKLYNENLDIFSIPEFLEIDLADAEDGDVFHAWNEINIIPNCQVETNPDGTGLLTRCDNPSVTVSAPSYTMYGNPIDPPGPNDPIAINDPRANITFDPRLTTCGVHSPVSTAYLNSFCNDSSKYNPALPVIQENEIANRYDAPSYDSEGMDDKITLFPNPVSQSDPLTVSMDLEEAVQQMQLTVTNLYGQTLVASATESSLLPGKFNLQLPVQDWQAGQYICVIQLDDRTVTKLFTKM